MFSTNLHISKNKEEYTVKNNYNNSNNNIDKFGMKKKYI